MAKDHRSTAALAAAERLYKRKPDATTDEFRKVCEKADKATIGKLTNREFNASYVLPFRRSAALRGRSTGKRRGTAAGRGRRGSGRGVEARLALMVRERDAEVMGAANDPRKAYQVAAGVDDFVVEILKAAKR